MAESILLSILGDLRRYLSLDPGSEVEREVHGRNVIHCNTPAQRLISLVSSGKGGRMLLGKVITNFVHVGHKKQADGSEIFVLNPARKSVADAEVGNFRG